MLSQVRRAAGAAFLVASLLGICGTWTGVASAATPHGVPAVSSATGQYFAGEGPTYDWAYSVALTLAENAGYTQSECSVYDAIFISHDPLVLEVILDCTK